MSTHTYSLDVSPKTLLEAVSYAAPHLPLTEQGRKHREVLAEVGRECERKRPTGPDGKHDERHTDECGCGPERPGGWEYGVAHYEDGEVCEVTLHDDADSARAEAAKCGTSRNGDICTPVRRLATPPQWEAIP